MVPRPPSLGAILFEKSAVLSEARVYNTGGVVRRRGTPLDGTVALVEKPAIIREPIRKM
jgi:hypothetical protein